MVQLLKPGPDKKYVDLTVAFESEQGEDIPGPPVRYYFQWRYFYNNNCIYIYIFLAKFVSVSACMLQVTVSIIYYQYL